MGGSVVISGDAGATADPAHRAVGTGSPGHGQRVHVGADGGSELFDYKGEAGVVLRAAPTAVFELSVAQVDPGEPAGVVFEPLEQFGATIRAEAVVGHVMTGDLTAEASPERRLRGCVGVGIAVRE